MKKEFKKSKADLVLLLIFFIPLSYISGKASVGYFLDGSYIYGPIFFLVFASIVNSMVSALIKTYRIEITDGGIRVSGLFKQNYLKWVDIKEFGRYQRLGYNYYHWVYYFKTDKSAEDKIYAFSENFPGAENIITIIFKNAKRARFISHERKSKIPIFGGVEVETWKS